MGIFSVGDWDKGGLIWELGENDKGFGDSWCRGELEMKRRHFGALLGKF